MFVGGEFYYDSEWVSPTPTLSTAGMYFLNGGKACLLVIGEYLRDHGIDKILLPAYLCPSILAAFDHCGLAYGFYEVNTDLSINLADLSKKVDGYRAVYFINYFGFLQALPARNYLRSLRQNGLMLVEDNAQAGFSAHPIGDFVFNSLRKLAPYDGGYLITRLGVDAYLEKYRDQPNRRLAVIRDYRRGLYRYLFEGQGSHKTLTEMFELAERYYEEDFSVVGDPQERANIEQLDWPGIRQARRENYRYLLEKIAPISEISVIFPALQEDNLPLGLPVYFNGASRDLVYEELGQAGIGLTIHWEATRDDPRTNANRQAVDMAGRMLTLVIDQRTGRKQLDYLAENLARSVENAKTKGK